MQSILIRTRNNKAQNMLQQHVQKRTHECAVRGVVLMLVLVASIGLSSCDMRVLNDEVAITQDGAQSANGTVLAVAGMLKSGFTIHQEIHWAASFVGEQELSPNRQDQTFVFAARIANENLVAADNSQNSTISRELYSAFALTDVVEAGLQNRFSANDGSDSKAKALITANMLAIRGILYADLAKFYQEIVEPKTGARLTPETAKQRAIDLLTQASRRWQEYYANPAPLPINAAGMLGVRVVGTTVTPDSAAVRKFVNSYIGMLHFDTGTRPQAAPFLANGYVQSDGGRELGYLTIDALNGPGVYPTARNFVAFRGLNTYSADFIRNRIPADTSRRAPSNWFAPGVATAINYFYPPSVRYPLITWQEVALMQAQTGAADSTTVKRNVLQSWNIPAPVATALSTDATITLERIARYEYIGRGRRWSVGNPATRQAWQRWPVSVELNVGN